MTFEKNFSFEKRLSEATRILKKYPQRVPVIVELNETTTPKFILDKCKYLVPNDLTVGNFLQVIRKRIKLQAHEAIFLFFNNSLVSNNTLISNVYEQHKSKDLFLYGTISQENTFGDF